MPCRSAGNICSRRLTASCLPDHAKSGNSSAVLRQTSRHGFGATLPFPLRFCRFIAVIRLIFTVFAVRLPPSAVLSTFSSSGCGHLLFSHCFCLFVAVFYCSFRFRTVSVVTLLFLPFLCRFHAARHCFPVISPPRFFVLPQTLPLTRFAFLPLLPALHSCRALKAACFRDRKRLSRTDSERGVRGESLIFSVFMEPGHRDRCLRAFFSGH